jgi:FAD synthetase
MERFPLDLSLLHAEPLLQQKVQDSVNLITESLRRYQPTEVGFSFNGGKDSVVLAALVLHVATKLELEKKAKPQEMRCRVGDIRTIFFLTEKEYPEMLEFMRDFASTFHLRVIELTCGIKEGLSKLVGEDGSMPDVPIKAMFMGTRRDDPHGKHLTGFSPTDSSWPSLMRVNPILEFQYHDIWALIKTFNLPYCKLYDKGFTSIGATDDTTTNEALWNPVLNHYAKPWMLPYGSYERLGRGCRNFLTKRGYSSLLAYPQAIIAKITKWVDFEDITHLFFCGNQALNRAIADFGVSAVSSLYKVSNSDERLPTHYYSLLKLFSGLTELKLTISCSNSILTPHSLERFIRSLPNLQTRLTSLNLNYFAPSQHGDMVNLTLDRLGGTSNLTSLSIYSNQSAPLGFLPHSTRHLSLHGPDIEPETLVQLPHLEHLSLSSIQSGAGFLEQIYRKSSLQFLHIDSMLEPTSLATPELSSLLSTSSLTRLEFEVVSDESVFNILPYATTSLSLGIKSIKGPFSLPPHLRRLVMHLTSDSDSSMAEKHQSNHSAGENMGSSPHAVAKGVPTLFPQFDLNALPNSLEVLVMCPKSALFTTYVPGKWPEGLIQLEVNLNLQSPQLLLPLPKTLKHMYVGSIIALDQHSIEPMHLLPEKLVSVTLPLMLIPAIVELLPRTLTSLTVLNSPKYSDFKDLSESERDNIYRALSCLPRDLKSFSTTEPQAKYLLSGLPASVECLKFPTDCSIDDAAIPLLPRSLTYLSLSINPSIFSNQLERLPPRIRSFIAPNAGCKLTAVDLADVLPPSLLYFHTSSISFGLGDTATPAN